jgi:hypothetical protein
MNPHDGFDRRIRFLLRMLPIMAICPALIVAGCSESPKTTTDPPTADAPKNVAKMKASQSPSECPGALASQPTGHKVVLTWNLSTSSKGPDDKSLGYCVYRSDQKIVVDTLDGCTDCKKITPTPIFGTGCVDDFGSDPNVHYYYAAIAVGPNGQRSRFSNKTSAKLPRMKKESRSGLNQTYPACRPAGGISPVLTETSPLRK